MYIRICVCIILKVCLEKTGRKVSNNNNKYINFYKSDETIKSEYDVKTEEEIQEIRDNGEDQKEVYEHWLCSEWFISKMKNQDEPILETDLGTWWGRTCTGQAIYLDYNVQELAYQYSHDQRLYKKEVA